MIKKRNKTYKNISNKIISNKITNQYNQQNIVKMFLQMLNTVKLYHWKTHNYSQHKATDELYSELNSNIDNFVETMLGKTGGRVNLTSCKSIPLFDFNNVTSFEKEIEHYKKFLINMNKDDSINITNNSDLLNIRDEILGSLNKFTYLLTLK
jgi:DNA-binding ferritin-like protein